MADDRRIELDDLLVRPGTYLNPQTEVLVVVDDSPSIDGEIFNLEEFEGADWVLISDEVPIDESRRDELLETFQATYHGGDGRGVAAHPGRRRPRRGRAGPRGGRLHRRGVAARRARRLPRRMRPVYYLGVFIPVGDRARAGARRARWWSSARRRSA